MSAPSGTSPWKGGHGPLLIAEIGGNHEGDFDYALQLTDLAARSGCDFIKFQLYRAPMLVSPVESPDRYRHFAGFELSKEQHVELARRCVAAGVGYMASVWDLEMLDWIDPYLPIYKIGSGDLTAYSLVSQFARRGKPIILSTGCSTLDEVRDAVRLVRSVNPVYEGSSSLAVLQCTSSYPIEGHEANLRAMDTIRDATGAAVGYSDHTMGSLALLIAAARGAQVLEFHFTDSREGKSFRDHAVSLTCEEVRSLCATLDEMNVLLGDGEKRPTRSEVDSGHVVSFRRGVYCRRPLKAGEVVEAEDLVVLRPNHGIDARSFDQVPGRRAARPLKAFEALDLQAEAAP